MLRAGRDGAGLQRGAEAFGYALVGAEQNGDVPVPDRAAVPVAVRDLDAAVDESADAVGDMTGLFCRLVGALLILRVGVGAHVDHREDDKFPALLRLGAHAERRGVVIGELAQPRGHQVGEDMVYRRKDSAAGAEILAQQEPARFPVRESFGRGRPGVVFGEKDPGIGQPEAVDRLLDIAHHEQLFPAVREEAEERVLAVVHVLVFVHQHLGVPLGQLGGQTVGGVLHQVEDKVLLIGEIHRALTPLPLGVQNAEPGGEVQQRFQRGTRGLDPLKQDGGVVCEQGNDLLAEVALAVVPEGGDAFDDGIDLFFVGAHGGEAHGDGAGGCPAPAGSRGQRPEPRRRLGEPVGAGLADLFPARLRQRFRQRVQARGAVFGTGGDAAEHDAAPAGLADVGDALRAQSLLHGAQPGLGMGVTLHGAVHPYDQFGESAVVPAGAEGIGQLPAGGVGVQTAVELLKGVVQRGGEQSVGAVGLQDPEVGGDPGGMGIHAQDASADAVDGADGRAGAQLRLAAQPPVAGARGKALVQGREDAAAHLAGGGAGEGDHKKAVDVVSVVHIAHQALDEHTGLSAARGGGDEPRSAAVRSGALLVNRQRHGHRLLPFCSPDRSCSRTPELSVIFAGATARFCRRTGRR